MSLVNSILELLRKKQTFAKDEVPEGYCPNCWGTQEYGGQFYEVVKNNNVDVNEANPNVGWIQDYANKNLGIIELKPEGEMMVCQKCKLKYKPA